MVMSTLSDGRLAHAIGSRLAPRVALAWLRRSDLVRVVALWLRRRRGRKALAGCDVRLLRDVGITRAQAERESAVPFWR